MPEYFPKEETAESAEVDREVLLLRNLGDKIIALHKSGGAKEGGVGIMEIIKLFSNEMMDFFEKGEKILGFNEEKPNDLSDLFSALIDGKLNSEDRKNDLRRLALYKVNFDKLYLYSPEDILPESGEAEFRAGI